MDLIIGIVEVVVNCISIFQGFKTNKDSKYITKITNNINVYVNSLRK